MLIWASIHGGQWITSTWVTTPTHTGAPPITVLTFIHHTTRYFIHRDAGIFITGIEDFMLGMIHTGIIDIVIVIMAHRMAAATAHCNTRNLQAIGSGSSWHHPPDHQAGV